MYRGWGGANCSLCPGCPMGKDRPCLKPFGIGHMFIQIVLLRMTDTMTSQNIDLSSWNTVFNRKSAIN
jgi:hypothetical protein